MPNKHAAKKALRKNRHHSVANLRIKTNVKSLFKKGIAAAKDGKKEDAIIAIRSFQQAIDKAAKRDVVSRNAANRKKSALMSVFK